MKNSVRGRRFAPLKLLWLLFWPVSFGLVFLARSSPEAVENVYSTAVYPVLAKIIGFLPGLLPFSFAEILVYALALGLIAMIVVFIVFAVRSPGRIPGILGRGLLTILAVAGAVYFCFYAFWGLNYYREPFADAAGLHTRPYGADELAELCEYLIQNANETRGQSPKDPDNSIKLKDSHREYAKEVNTLYERASEQYPSLAGNYSNPKGVLWSKGMSYLGIQGIFIPFSNEASVNIDMPGALVPAAMCHEAAHQHGYAREDEANFIAYAVCMYSDDPVVRYSGYVMALKYAMNELYTMDSERYGELWDTYDPGLKEDMRNDSLYWQEYEGPVQEASTNMNNAYLKHNDQEDGVKSYNRVVALLIAQQRDAAPISR